MNAWIGRTAAGLGALVLALGVQQPALAGDDMKQPAPKGCSEQCITKAWLTGKAPTLQLEVKTTVPAKLRVEASTELPVKTPSGPKFLAPAAKASTGNNLKSAWNTDFGPLKSATTYNIVAWATDKNGNVAYQQGTITTPKAAPGKGQTAGGGTVKAKGDGCDLDCIQKAWIEPGRDGAGLEIKTSVPSRMKVQASKFEALDTVSGPHFSVVHASASSGAEYRTQWSTKLDGLEPGTNYHVLVQAMDEQGRTNYRLGTFQTHHLHRVVTVTYEKLWVWNDADKWFNGELELYLGANGERQLHQGPHKVESGHSYSLPWPADGHLGWWSIILDGAPQFLDLEVLGQEHDPCSPSFGVGCVDFATAFMRVDLDAHSWSEPKRLAFETTDGYLDFSVEVTIAVEYR